MGGDFIIYLPLNLLLRNDFVRDIIKKRQKVAL
jgi:hypothetical protein